MWAALMCAAAVLSGCSGASSSAGAPSTPSAASTSPSAVHSTAVADVFTVTGDNPVAPNGSQDTHAQTPGTSCDSATLATDHAVGVRVARGFALAGFGVSADLLQHFLAGQGTPVSYRAGSQISRQARASAPFRTVNNEVQDAILSQLKAGTKRIRLSAGQLPALAFESTSSDLYWGFRGTQGLSVTGSGRRENGRFTGTLSYVIRDSYGFPVSDTLAGFGPPMRYLQTVCGAPQHAGGARWFPDTITVTVPFSRPA
jgi:hypothetical protein